LLIFKKEKERNDRFPRACAEIFFTRNIRITRFVVHLVT